MTEETPGREEQPDVPADNGTPDQAGSPEQATAGSAPEGAAPAGPDGDAAQEQDEQGEQGESTPVDVALTAQLDQVRTALDERTKDLQRLQAEYQNYRRRVDRDRIAVKEVAIANLLTELLPVLDDVGRARDHGELVGGFKSVAESLETVVAKMGLMQFGKEGEPFDPLIHEALMHSYSPDVTETTCVQILQPGYRIGERTIRPARVAVAEPQPGAAGAANDEAAGASGSGASGASEAKQADGGTGGDEADKENGGPDEG
ncbi:nucleotide exchange factor GrpE [Streptomyces sp. A7024]|uniref:Protein GrpE n=1 Tax=Streptomyces coryli TaxID=1128680 RepID=A0A6G4U027_9ACTN|nr:nucleotide exchange factor GrpE [Streptomyces coryli]